MGRKPSTPPPLSLEEFSRMLAAHRQWLASEGKEGQPASLSGANLEGLDLSGSDLSGLDFREANLSRVKFGDALVEDASFRATNLREADLSGVRGLLAPQLAGADLAGAKVPEDLQEFSGIKHVDAASGHVQRLFFLLLLVCVYCWLTIAVTTDANLLNNFAETPLPIINTKINLVMFYWAAPFLLLCVYLYFHLCLQRLWEALVELPGVFPDGLPLPHRVHPWLWNGLVLAYFPRLQDRRPPLLVLQKLLAILLIWWAGPLTLLALWYRYLPAHDWTITIFQLVLLTLALDGALGFSLLTRATLRLQEIGSSRGKKPWRKVKGVALLLSTAGIAALSTLFSLAAIEGPEGFHSLAEIDFSENRPWVSAYLTGADVSLKPPQWTGKPGDIDLVRGANLEDRNLRGAKAYKVFLVKADLSFADLRHSWLIEANFQKANLLGADLERANLQGADFQGALGLAIRQVRSADCWPLAKYSQEMLEVLQLPPEHNGNLDRKNLYRYPLSEANLRGARLSEFILSGANLKGADLEKANFYEADLTGADLHGANLSRVSFLSAKGLDREQVRSAACWQLAKYYSAEMEKILLLPPEHNKNLEAKNFKRYDLGGANLLRANLSRFNLQQANLRGANLQKADMRRADLSWADLIDADLTKADLTGADLHGANLSRADFQNARGLQKDQVQAARCWPLARYPQEVLKVLKLPPEHNGNIDKNDLSGYQLPRTDFRGAYLRSYNLLETNLQGVNLEKAWISGADLSGADLHGANLKGADLREAKGLTRDQLQSAIMDEHTQLPDDLKDLVPSGSQKP